MFYNLASVKGIQDVVPPLMTIALDLTITLTLATETITTALKVDQLVSVAATLYVGEAHMSPISTKMVDTKTNTSLGRMYT